MGLRSAKSTIRTFIKDTPFERYVWWGWKRCRGIRIPLDNVRNEIYDQQAFEIMGRCYSGGFGLRGHRLPPRGLSAQVSRLCAAWSALRGRTHP